MVATPNNFHLPLVCQALEAGKLTICEKPVAMSSAELQQMMDTAKRTGTPFTTTRTAAWMRITARCATWWKPASSARCSRSNPG